MTTLHLATALDVELAQARRVLAQLDAQHRSARPSARGLIGKQLAEQADVVADLEQRCRR